MADGVGVGVGVGLAVVGLARPVLASAVLACTPGTLAGADGVPGARGLVAAAGRDACPAPETNL